MKKNKTAKSKAEKKTGKGRKKAINKENTNEKPRRFKARSIPFFLIAVLCLLYYLTICVLAGSYRSFTWIWIVGAIFFACLGICFYMRGSLPYKNPFCAAAIVLFLLLLAAFLMFEGFVIANALSPVPEDAECIIILGAAVRGDAPSKALYKRIEAAYEYLKDHPDTVAVLSGGQGKGENISEAECMRRELVALGIDETRLILEDKSTSTSENIKNSLDIIGDKYKSIAVVTNNFHVFRAKLLLAARFEGEVSAIGASFSDPLLFHYAVREFAGFCNDGLKGNLT